MCSRTARRSLSLPIRVMISEPLDTSAFLGRELYAPGFKLLDDILWIGTQ